MVFLLYYNSTIINVGWTLYIIEIQMNDRSKNYVGYIRASTKKQAEGDSFRRQEEYINKWVEGNQGTLIGCYKEIGSGTKLGDVLQKVIDLCEQYDGVLCTEATDRLDRTGGSIIDLISEKGIRFETPELFLMSGGINNYDILKELGKFKDVWT